MSLFLKGDLISFCVTNRVAYNNKCPVPSVTGGQHHAKMFLGITENKPFAAYKVQDFWVFLVFFFLILFIHSYSIFFNF